MCFREPRGPRTSSCGSTFVRGKPVQIGQSEACEFFGIAFSLFPSPLQVTLEQAATAVGLINARTRRPEDRPCCVCGPSHRNLVHHSLAPATRT
ncbi:hypothetical protein B5V03_13180 [Bradyrhizobium betae]|uniref:Uncharacterized protein n=1 Tax=Bradyrhizobium betae TaxID=244734 RepID=A0A4Q1VCM3_9BRAD|nr:hypothetical protein B5V03_13180 [Bradyrhizobium betae]